MHDASALAVALERSTVQIPASAHVSNCESALLHVVSAQHAVIWFAHDDATHAPQALVESSSAHIVEN